MVIIVTVTVTVIVTVTVTVDVISDSGRCDNISGSDRLSLHLYFRVVGWGKERGLYPPSGWCRRTQGVGSSFRLELVNQGVIASFWLEPENTGSWSFLVN
jgi:hypothetical protein